MGAVIKHVIECDVFPSHKDCWDIKSHKSIPTGRLEWNINRVFLFISDGQKREGGIYGHELYNELQSQMVLNGNVLNYLIEHQELIPELWKGPWIYFWGTIYRSTDKRFFVRYMYWSGSRWRPELRWLNCRWGGGDPALCLRL